MSTPQLMQGDPMAEPKEVALTTVAERRAKRVADVAAEMRRSAQAEYDAAVGAKQTAVRAHVEALNALDRAGANLSEDAAAALAAMRQTTVAQHIANIEALSETIELLTPQIDVAFWMTAAEQQVAASEAQGS